MPINVTTVYTKERMLRYHYFLVASKKFLWIVMAVCTLVAIGGFAFLASRDALSFTFVACLISIAVIDISYVYLYLIRPRKTIDKSKNLNMVAEYSFDEDCLNIQATNEYANETSTIKYSMLSSFKGNGTDMYLFIARNRGYIVDVTELSKEQTELLINILDKGINSK